MRYWTMDILCSGEIGERGYSDLKVAQICKFSVNHVSPITAVFGEQILHKMNLGSYPLIPE